MKRVEEYPCGARYLGHRGKLTFWYMVERGILATTSFVNILADRHVLNVNAMCDLYNIGSIDGIHLILIRRTVQRGTFIARTAAYRLK